MPLENLLTLIEKLRERIDNHGDALRQSEALTRYALIDPLLRELGWDTEDPDVVVPEYSSGSGRVDYALCKNGKSVIMLEAKKLDTPLNDAIGQGIQYCLVEGTEYFAVTDGQRWEIYETHKPVPIDDKRIIQFDLKDPSAAACLKALALWRPSVISGQIAVGETPVVGLPENQTRTTDPQPVEESTVQPTEPDQDDAEWTPLSVFVPEPKTLPPSAITFPDGSRASPKRWYEILTETARWLVENGNLSESQCPILRGPRSKKSLVDIESVHSDGTSFFNFKSVGSLYIDTHGNAMTLINRSKYLIQYVNQDPAQFKVRLP